MIETEGICDDCNGPMIQKANNIWYCPHCQMFLEWCDVGQYYVYLDDEEIMVIKHDE